MRIALVHSYYTGKNTSGENLVVDAQAAALARAGHEVRIFSRSTDQEAAGQSLYPVRAAYRTVTGRGPDPTPMLAAFAPDIVHIHNVVPNIGVDWVKKWPGPIVHTIHNYRPLCSNAYLFRDGEKCTECPDGKPLSGIVHGCYLNSRVKSIPITVRNSFGVEHNTLLQRADVLIVLSELQRGILARYGVDEAKMVVIPNGLPEAPGEDHLNLEPPAEERWLTVGRLSGEKGIKELVEIWPAGVPLDVYGDGPEREEIAANAPAVVEFKGQVPNEELRALLPGYTGMVFPSRCFETQGMAVVEAFAAGVPVVARAGSASAEIVAGVDPEWVYEGDDQKALGEALFQASTVGAFGRVRSSRAYAEAFSALSWASKLGGVYQRVREQSASARGRPVSESEVTRHESGGARA